MQDGKERDEIMMQSVGTQKIRTAHLLLRPFQPEDVDAVYENWAADPAVQKNYGEPVYPTREAVQTLLETYIGRYASPDVYRWAIVLPEPGVCIGQIAFYLVDVRNRFAEIEYCIGQAFQGRGFATEATKAILKYGFAQIGLHKIQISHRSNNLASRRVIAKCGFHPDGVHRDALYLDGAYYDRVYYSLLESEYPV